ncbi:MAG: hypothetical protein V1901_03935 [Patescibacteria group bacterium]
MFIRELLEEFKKFNVNLRDVIEAIRDLNIMLGNFIGFKVSYKGDKNENL